MPDISTKTSRRDHRALQIALPDGDVLIPRDTFANDHLHVDDRTVRRMNLPTVYVGGFPYIKRNGIIAGDRGHGEAPQSTGEAPSSRLAGCDAPFSDKQRVIFQ